MTPQDSPPTDTNQNSSDSNQTNASQVARELHPLEKLNIFGQMGLVIVGVIAALIYGCQLHQMVVSNRTTQQAVTVASNTLTETQRSNKAQECLNRKTLQATIDQFNRDQRPYITQTAKTTEGPTFHDIPTIPGSGQILWNWHMTNYGKSPANDISFTQEIKLAEHKFVPEHGETRPSIGPPQMTGSDVFSTVISDPISRDEFTRLLEITDGITIRIKIHYTGLDGGTNYETGLCLSRTNVGSITYCKNDNYIK